MCTILTKKKNITVYNFIGIYTAEGSKEVELGKIPGLNGIKVLQIAAGAEHSALVTGSIFALYYICLYSKTCVLIFLSIACVCRKCISNDMGLG